MIAAPATALPRLTLLLFIVVAGLWLSLGPSRVTVARDRLAARMPRRARPLLPGDTTSPQASASTGPFGLTPWPVAWMLLPGLGILGLLAWFLGAPAASIGSGCVGAFVAGLVWRVRGRARDRAAVERRQAHVIELLESLSAEVTSGQPPSRALAAVSLDWPELAPVAASAVAGGDVPAVLIRQSVGDGGDALRQLAAAWVVAEESGAGLSLVLDRLIVAGRAEQETRREVTSALAGPRATARMLAALPLLGLGLGAGLGGDPIALLLETGFGLLCLITGTALAVLGVWWVERLAGAAEW